MAAAVQQRQDNEIDRFISDQRQKLQQERHTGNDGETERGRRRQWDKSGYNQYAEQIDCDEDESANAFSKPCPTPELSLKLGQYEKVRLRLNAERQQEYNDLLQNLQSPRDLYNYDVVKKEMMEDKKKGYLDYLQQNQGRALKKEPTPPLEGMKFGGYEEYKREQEPERRRQYKEDLEKQKREQAYIKMKRDYPNKQPVANASPRQGETTDRSQYRSRIEKSQQKQYGKMLAQQPAVRDVRHQDTQPRRRSPSPEFSDPGMQLQAERIRARIRDLPTRPEEVEELQKKQQQQDTLQRQLEEISPRVSYEERRPPPDLSPRLDDYGPGPSDRYPSLQEDYRQPTQLKVPSKKKDDGDLLGEGLRLPLSGHEGQRQQLKEAVKKDYNDMLAQQGTNILDKDTRALQGEAISLPLSGHEEKRRKMVKERQEEYKDMLAQKKFQGQPKNRCNVEGEDKSLPVSNHTEQRKQLPQDKTHDNVETVAKRKSEKSVRNPLEGEAISLPLSGHQKERQRLMEERRREYNEMISQLKSKKTKGKGTKSTFVPEERNTSDNKNVSDTKRRDFTQQYDSEDEGRETTDLEKKLQQLRSMLEPDPYPRDQARPELLTSMPQGQYEMERERVDYDRQRQNEEMLSKLEENRIFLNRIHHPWRENPTRQTLKDAVPVHSVSAYNVSPVVIDDYVTPVDDEVEQVEQEQKQNTGRRLKREKDEGRPVTPGGLLNKMGRDQQDRTNKLNNERKKEYNQLLTQQAVAIRDMTKSYAEVLESERSEDPRPVRGHPPRPDYKSVPPRTQARFEDSQQESFSGGLPGPSAGDTEQMRKRTERNDEYNEFLRNKEDKQRSNSADRRPPLPRERERPRSRHGRNSPQQEEVPRLDLGGGAQPPTLRRKQKQPETFVASLPGLQTNSAQRRRKEEERNREYNEMLKKQKGRGRGRGSPRDAPPETRRGWQTPTYDEILEKKRREERQYRRQEEPYGDNRGMRPYASEGAINRVGVDEVKMRDLDREYEQRRVRFQNDRSKEQGILDDDNWLRTDAAKEQQYSKLVKRISGPKAEGYLDSKSDSELEENFGYRQRQRENTEEAPNPRQKDMSRPPGDFFATLPLGKSEGERRDRGQPSRDSATQRKKQKYRDELQLQMRDQKAAKFREKNEELMVAASGYLDPEKTPVRVRNLGQPGISPRRRARSPEVTAYHAKIVQRQQAGQGSGYDPSGDFGLGGGVAFGADASAPKGRRRDQGGYEPSAYLDGGGFDTNLLEPRRPKGLALPPGLQYQPSFAALDPDTGVPSTYITGQDSIGGLNAHSSIDDAYRFYGMRNPLDPEPAGGGTGVPPLNLGGDNQAPRGRSPRVTFDDSHRGILKDSARRPSRHRSPGRTTPYQFDADQEDRSTTNMNKREYANDLARQMELDKMKRERAKQENMRYEKKIEEDMLNYNPFGRSGGGAPNLDAKGQPIADLRQMKRRVDDPSYSPTPRESPRFRAPVSPKDDLIPPPPGQINAEGESTYALGGHGIFGNPRTEEEKSKADKYKDDLRLQILEKKRHDQLIKEQEKIEEEKENRRLEEQRQRIQRDFDEEQRKKRDKEEENRRKQEELIRKNEEKRREAERSKREKAEIRQRDRERELDDQTRFESQHRTSSPPVPTLRSKLATTDGEPKGEGEDARTDSPPVPASRTQQEPRPQPKARPPPEPVQRANSSDVLRELANMRQQLESERKRVEGALNKQRNEPEVFDPRLVQRPPPKEVDVFERATQGNASVPQRVTDNANPKNIQEFQDLKYKAPDEGPVRPPAAPTSEASTGDTESRRAFRSMFPEQPYTNNTLESQQDAMLRQQNEQIRTLKDRSYVPPNDLGMSARQGTGTPRSLLQANTAFIDVENVNHFPEDFDDMPKRNDSARFRRRERATPLHDLAGPSNVMGSVSSLDVDRLQRKNDARIRRLQQMNADEVSMADPDEILENFMAKQRYNRPPSGQTLQDDTWLQPGNKQL
ncbi:trichohyalin-like [Mizuhopecten yessoensis]|uniref:trichohyalin-like n=1 Tax=Mizuhopecten yessoensis TaxID=6573 RepID=UPI000B45F267|nr:trichohyalin-like [Mizuhopecten yessoensis]